MWRRRFRRLQHAWPVSLTKLISAAANSALTLLRCQLWQRNHRIVTAALELLDEQGMDALTVRALASRLDVKAPSGRHPRPDHRLRGRLRHRGAGAQPVGARRPRALLAHRTRRLARRRRRTGQGAGHLRDDGDPRFERQLGVVLDGFEARLR
ncbi:TetR family transcriptional regulator [Nocardia sp. CA-290969]|uniref:TetR family transcriptional regulator n=1 Tax=Nocardia sp. CA-290969 TaxID=3239986 RepID=UPI003D938927